ncbi:ferredoxin [Streptomyces sp. NPDC101455]|uniref:ferredoxin n=1 Tax=Streptomyces sp. NPDC101455 TaxID=3366142 RepID=UPI00381E3BB0
MRIIVDPEHCVGAGQCALTAPTLFTQDSQGLVTALQNQLAPTDEQAAREAAQLCPAQAIHLTE